MLDKLKLFLSTFSLLLEYEKQPQWAHHMHAVENMLDSDFDTAYDRYTSAYGGAGTLNDIHISDPWSLTLFWKLRTIINIHFQCLELKKDIFSELVEFEQDKLENLKVHCCTSCNARFVTERDLIQTQIPAKVNKLMLEEVNSHPTRTLYERFCVARKESVALLEELSVTIDESWSIIRSDPSYQPCDSCKQNTLKLQNFKFDGDVWSMLT
ncbi:hypothetical protein A9Q84_01750 [Halobacteriovorax marinus]|uniref:Uncharacterized protein n=1 Tax=Halobacteriovorax marinus TaxID=97084 RepID=A0A1Y5FG98_9BACT|nr:hypothetical protein A9Q84_01750 [Halobacteriovorax marinus]